jgi:NTP pyrophosphatase (non-canonical NTP hydrolase)
MISQELFAKLVEERERQHQKFGDDPHATVEGFIRIAGEEFGEVCRGVNQHAKISELKKEILQLACVCIAFLDGDLHDGLAP